MVVKGINLSVFIFNWPGKMITFTKWFIRVFAGSLESAYSLNWGAHRIWGQGGGEPLAFL